MGTSPSPFSRKWTDLSAITVPIELSPTEHGNHIYNPSSYSFRESATYSRSRSSFDSRSPLLPSASPSPSIFFKLVPSSLFLPPAPPSAPPPPPLLLRSPSPTKENPFRDVIGTCSTSQSSTAESRSVDHLSPSSDGDGDGDDDGDDTVLSSHPLVLVPCACCPPSALPRPSTRPCARTKRPQSANPHASLLPTTDAKLVSRSSIPLAPRNVQ